MVYSESKNNCMSTHNLFIFNHDSGEGRGFLAFISFWCMGLSAAMGTLGAITVIDNKPKNLNDVTNCFLGAYMVLFAAILFLYELCWWQPFPAINRTFRKNFGFMYGLRSKGFYLVFIAFLTIGLYDSSSSSIQGLDWATGIGWLATGFFLVFVSGITIWLQDLCPLLMDTTLTRPLMSFVVK